MNQRCATLSQSTTGSPPATVLQSVPVKPVQIVFITIGPSSFEPVVLSYTAYDRFTVSTNCVLPTDPLVSGGTAPPDALPPRPAKFSRLVVPTGGRLRCCAIASGCVSTVLNGVGRGPGTKVRKVLGCTSGEIRAKSRKGSDTS